MVVQFADAVHPTHATRPADGWGPKQEYWRCKQTSRHQRLNIHGDINLEIDRIWTIGAETIDAASTITLLALIEALYPDVGADSRFLDNARYHHAKPVQEWLAQLQAWIVLRFISPYFRHLNPVPPSSTSWQYRPDAMNSRIFCNAADVSHA